MSFKLNKKNSYISYFVNVNYFYTLIYCNNLTICHFISAKKKLKNSFWNIYNFRLVYEMYFEVFEKENFKKLLIELLNARKV